MRLRFFAVLTGMVVLVAFAMVLSARNHRAPSNAITVTSQTKGDAVLTAEFLNGQVRIRLTNNYKDTITAFVIRIGDTNIITADFAYSEVRAGIEPGDTFQREFPATLRSSQLPTVSLLTVLLKDGTEDGDSKHAQRIKDQRLGQKVQMIRTLKVLEQEGQLPDDLGTLKKHILAALDTEESETRIILKELRPALRADDKLSDDFKAGLQWGREGILRTFEDIELQPPTSQHQGVLELKDRLNKQHQKL